MQTTQSIFLRNFILFFLRNSKITWMNIVTIQKQHFELHIQGNRTPFFFFHLSLPAALPNPALKSNLEIFPRALACDFFFPGASYGSVETMIHLCSPVTTTDAEWMWAGEVTPRLSVGEGREPTLLKPRLGCGPQGLNWVLVGQRAECEPSIGVTSPPLSVDHKHFGGRVTTEKQSLQLNVLLSSVSTSDSG